MGHAGSSFRSKISESDAVSGDYPGIGVRQFGRFNWLGLWTLYLKVRRFTKVWMQTLMAPIVTTLLFLAIFSSLWQVYAPILTACRLSISSLLG